jgi:hypothetical protein
MTPRSIATVIASVAAMGALPAAAVADGGRTSWPGTAALAGAWSGTAASTAITGFTFPVMAEIAVADTGRPTGRVVLGAPVNCRGTWTPVSTTGRVTSFAEDITSDIAGTRCLTGGTVRLSTASGGRLRYRWSRGDAGSVAYLVPRGISGTWRGTVQQGGLGSMQATIRVNGVRRGDMPGRTRYAAPLACGGDITPIGAGTQRAATFRERITQSASPTCVGIGTTILRMRADGRLAYRWTGGGEVSTGIFRRAS